MTLELPDPVRRSPTAAMHTRGVSIERTVSEEEGALIITMASAVGGGRHTHIPAGTNREHLRQDEGALVWVGIAFSSAHDCFAVLPEDKRNG